MTGTGTSAHWREVALAWHGVTYGVSEPLQHRDLGLYVAQLPVWRLAHGFFLLLVLLGLGIVFGLYMLVGAVRWIDGRPAINSHARVHIGWLLVGLALALHLGLPARAVRADRRSLRPGGRRELAGDQPGLAHPRRRGPGDRRAHRGWAMRPRHALVAAGWIVLAFASLVGHWMVPPALGGEGSSAASPAAIERLDRKAYGLESLSEERVIGDGRPTPPPVPSFWNTAAIRRIVAGDSVDVLAVDQAALPGARARRPVWLAARSLAGRRLAVSAVADDRVGPKGQPLFYGPGDTLPRPGPVALLELGPGSFSPLAPKHWLVGSGRHGVEAGGWPRRVMLAWALQAPGLLRQLPAGLMVDWRLSPSERLGRLAPFVEWGDPLPRVIDGELVWLLDGYVAADAFPLSSRLAWRGRRVGALEAGFLATVDAASGATHIYLRPAADALAAAWAGISRGVVEPASAIPEGVLRQASYPVELFRVQARQLEQGQWKAGSLGGGQPLADPADVPLTDQGWTDDTATVFRLAAYERQTERRLDAVLWAAGPGGVDGLRLLRLDTTSVVPSRAALEARWNRFASYDALSDSIGDDGGKLEDGPVRLDVRPSGVVAYQSHIAWSRSGAAVAWLSVAAGERLGAGRSLREAWSNLLGASAPSIPGAPRPPGWTRRAAGSSAPTRRCGSGTGPASDGPGPVCATPSARAPIPWDGELDRLRSPD